jgi:hypothetical protein
MGGLGLSISGIPGGPWRGGMANSTTGRKTRAIEPTPEIGKSRLEQLVGSEKTKVLKFPLAHVTLRDPFLFSCSRIRGKRGVGWRIPECLCINPRFAHLNPVERWGMKTNNDKAQQISVLNQNTVRWALTLL